MKKIKRSAYLLSVLLLLCTCLFTVNASNADSELINTVNTENKSIAMYYDDYLSLENYTDVNLTDKGIPTSYKVGYGIEEGTKDDAVIELSNGYLHAVGIGSASIELTDETGTFTYSVTVTKAPISMFLLIGQSNMRGSGGNANQSIANTDGQVYSSYAFQSYLTVKNAAQFIPSALTGEKSKINTQGGTKYLSDAPVNLLNESGKGKEGPDSGIAYQWNKMTGDKVWTVNAAHGSTAILKWLKGNSEYEQAVAMFKPAQKVMAQEIAAGHYELKDYGYFWLQGCSDDTKTAEYYYNCFMSMHENLKEDLAFDFDGDGEKEKFEFADIIMPLSGNEYRIGYRVGEYSDTTTHSYYESFLTLEMRGQRVAQYYICNTPGNDIHLVSNIGESWVYMPDGTEGVTPYFREHYPNGRVDYPVQVQQAEEWYTPTTPKQVHDTIHYRQIGFNELGIDAARNAVYTHGRAEKPENIETKVTFYDWTGYRQLSSIDAKAVVGSSTLAVPVVYPVYESKNVTYEILGEDISYYMYDLTAKVGAGAGAQIKALGVSDESVITVNGNAAAPHTAGHKITTGKASAPACSSPGYSEYIYCSDCKKYILKKTQTYPALGHKFSAYVNDNNASYLSDATKTAKCTVCGDKDIVYLSGTKLTLGKPKTVTADSKANSLTLSWSKVKDATGYRVYIYENGGWKTLKNTTARSYTVTSLKAGTKYKLAVRAYVTVSGKTAWCPEYKQAEFYTNPAAPSIVKATRSTSSVTLKWSSVKGATGYRVYVYNKGWKALKTTAEKSYTITKLNSGTRYIYCVRPYIRNGSEVLWGEYKKITVYTNPSTPKLRTASTAKGRATVAWNNVNGESGYQVWYSTSKYGKYTKLSNYKADTVKIYKTGLKSGRTYYFKVRAYKDVGNGYIYSSFSSPVSLKIK